MDSPLSHSEARLVVREWMERQDIREKRRKFFNSIFVVGVGAAIGAGIIAAVVQRNLWLGLLVLIWVGSTLMYTEFLTIPRTFMQDMDLRWHLNPWQEALERLSDDNRLVRGIVLLTAYPVLRETGVFIYWGLK
jgi:hypothetical protein